MKPRIEKLKRMSEAVLFDVKSAITLQAIWKRCADKKDILDAMSGVPEGLAFGPIRDSLLVDLVLTLMRLYDRDEDASSITRVVHHLRDNGVRQAIMKEWRDWRLNLGYRVYENADAAGLEKEIAEALRRNDIDAADKEAAEVTQKIQDILQEAEAIHVDTIYLTLRTVRDKLLAHREYKASPIKHGAKYGYESQLLGRTMNIAKKIAFVVLGSDRDLAVHARQWARNADRFWSHVAQRVRARP